MVVIIGCGSYAVPQTDMIILYLMINVNGYIIVLLMFATTFLNSKIPRGTGDFRVKITSLLLPHDRPQSRL